MSTTPRNTQDKAPGGGGEIENPKIVKKEHHLDQKQGKNQANDTKPKRKRRPRNKQNKTQSSESNNSANAKPNHNDTKHSTKPNRQFKGSKQIVGTDTSISVLQGNSDGTIGKETSGKVQTPKILVKGKPADGNKIVVAVKQKGRGGKSSGPKPSRGFVKGNSDETVGKSSKGMSKTTKESIKQHRDRNADKKTPRGGNQSKQHPNAKGKPLKSESGSRAKPGNKKSANRRAKQENEKQLRENEKRQEEEKLAQQKLEEERIKEEQRLEEERRKKEQEELRIKAQLERETRAKSITESRQEYEKYRKSNAVEQVKASRKQMLEQKKKLVSDIKKTATFIKKIRMISEDSCNALVKDIEKLNLSRYISEVVTAISEAPIKAKDCTGIGKVVSAMHQRYDEFSMDLIESLETEFYKLADSTDKDDVARRRIIFRLLTEFLIVGVITDPSTVIKCLRRLVRLPAQAKMMPEDLSKIPLSNLCVQNMKAVVLFLKNGGNDIALLYSKVDVDFFKSAEAINLPPVDIESIPEKTRERFATLVMTYLNQSIVRLEKEHEQLKKREERNAEETISRGSLSDRSKELYEGHLKSFEQLKTNTFALCELLNRDEPVLVHESEEQQESKETGIALWDRRKDGAEGEEALTLAAFCYGDEETRAFYEDVPDLAAMLPAALFDNKLKQQLKMQQQQLAAQQTVMEMPSSSLVSQPLISTNPSKGTLDDALSQFDSGRPQVTPVFVPVTVPVRAPKLPSPTEKEDTVTKDGVLEEGGSDESDDDSETNGGGEDNISRKVDELLGRLPNCLSREATDKFATDFCHVQTKGSRKRLVRELAHAPWSRPELLPYYARVTAILSTVLKGIGSKLIETLEREFRGLLKNKGQFRLETRLRNARFIAELVKFNGVDIDPEDEEVKSNVVQSPSKHLKIAEKLAIPPEKAFYVLNTCFKEFKGHNIDIACAVLETCGCYLYRRKDTHARTKYFLEILMRHRKARHMTPNQINLVENAYYYCIPPIRQAKVVKERTPIERFVRFLFLELLGSDKEPFGVFRTDGKRKSNRKSNADHIHYQKSLHQRQVNFCVKKLKKLSWRGEQARHNVAMVSKIALKCAKTRASAIPLVCKVVTALCDFSRYMGIHFTDILLERIEQEMCTNDSRTRQRRIGLVRLFANLYLNEIVDPNTMLDFLYWVLHYGHSLPWSNHLEAIEQEKLALEQLDPQSPEYKGLLQKHEEAETFRMKERLDRMQGPGIGEFGEYYAHLFHPRVPCETDPPEDAFRLHLVSVVLSECGSNFVRGYYWNRLKRFLVYLQRYAASKTTIPLGVEFEYVDMLRIIKRERDIVAPHEKSISVTGDQKDVDLMDDINFICSIPKSYELTCQIITEIEEREKVIRERNEERLAASQKPEEEEEEEIYEEESEDSEDEDEEEDAVDQGSDLSEDNSSSDESIDSDDLSEDDSEDDSEFDDTTDDSSSDDDDSDLSTDSEDEDTFELPMVRTEEDEMFEEEFARLMEETVSKASATTGRAQNADNMAVPRHLFKTKTIGTSSEELAALPMVEGFNEPEVEISDALKNIQMEENGDDSEDPNGVRFRLLKRSNKGKIEAKTILIPEHATIAKSTQREERAEKEEHLLMKKYVLEYESRAAAAAIEEEIQLRRQGIWNNPNDSEKELVDSFGTGRKGNVARGVNTRVLKRE